MSRALNSAGRVGVARLAAGLVALGAILAAGCSRGAPPGAAIDARITFGEVGTSPGQFSYPRGVDTDGRHLWIVDKMARVQRIDPTTGAPVGGFRMPEHSLGKPTGITTWTPANRAEPYIFLADTHYHRVLVYDGAMIGPPGARGELPRVDFVATFGSYGEGDGQFVYPTDVAVLANADNTRIERLYVGEYGGHDRISIYEPVAGQDAAATAGGSGALAFRFVRAFGTFGGGPGVEFNRPQSIAIDVKNQRLVVTDACNHRLGVFTLEGELVRWISSPENISDGPGHFRFPYGLALLEDGTVLVTEFGNNRLQRIDPGNGKCLGIFGHAGRGPGELATPWASVVQAGVVYVLDSGNGRVLGFDLPRARPVVASGNGAGAGAGAGKDEAGGGGS